MRIISFIFLFPAAANGFRHHLSHHQRRVVSIHSISSLYNSHTSLFSSSLDDDTDSTMTASIDEKYRFLTDDDAGGIGKIVDDYDVFLLDMWGVMHDGIQPYEGVPEVVQKLKEAGKKLIILSNSSKRRANSVKMLKKLGFSPDDDFDEIITSGEVAHHLLLHLSSSSQDDDSQESRSSWVPKNIPEAFQELRDKNNHESERKQLSAFCFGSGDGDEDYLNSCGCTLAETMETADLIVARGTFVVLSDTECADKNVDEGAYWSAYQSVLERASKLKKPLPMVVCNPDKVRPDADKSPMPGTIGVAYQELLQENRKDANAAVSAEDLILSLGKPFSSVYDIAQSSIIENNNNDDDHSDNHLRVVMVGDALETDVTGATMTGIDSIWVVKDGIHNQDIAKASSSMEGGCDAVLEDFNKHSEGTYAKGLKVSPTVVLPHFQW